jgi:hypothetical protein
MRQRIKISELMKQFKLPEHAEFVGIVVHLPSTDEFLAHYEDTPDASNYVWAKVPDLAFTFESQKKAEGFVKSYGKGAVVGLLFDLGDTYSLHVDQ